MKKMKLALTALLLAAVMSVPATAFAQQPGDYMGDVLNTDIRVYINDVRIQGYNIEGYTYVVAEQLRAYGFNVYWNESARSLSVTKGPSTELPAPVADNLYPVGSVAFPYLYTDIVAYVDGVRVPSHAIDGQTVIRVDNLAQAFGSLVWDPVARTVYVTTAAPPPPAPTPTPVPVATPTPQPIPLIANVSYDRVSVENGQSVTVTVTTNRNVNYVWVELGGGEYVDATYHSTNNLLNEKTWVATIYPQRTGDVTVNANITREHRGAAVKTQRITVTAVVVSIQNVRVDRTSITEGQSVTFTITTTLPVNNVWLEYGGTSSDAVYRRTDGNTETWEATIYPARSERVTIYANSARTHTGAASKTQQITVNKQHVEILRATPSRTTIYQGESVSVSIETSVGAEQVYLEFDNTAIVASYSHTSGNTMIWTANIVPYQSQQVGVAAYARNNQYDAARTYFYINVNPQIYPPVPPTPPTPIPIVTPVIHGVIASEYTIVMGAYTTLVIETTSGFDYIYVEYGGMRLRANLASVHGDRYVYQADVAPVASEYIEIIGYAGDTTVRTNIYIVVVQAFG